VRALFDLDAYLERIGLRGRPGIAQVHRAHLTSIPFENLDPHQGLPVSLEVGDLERKLVAERRGGYCFEQNLLMKAALEALGAEVDMLVDAETSNWWTSTHPRSRFVTGLIVGLRGDDGTGTLLCDWSELSLSEQTPAGTSMTPLEREAIPELLATRFSLPGFALSTDERIVRAAGAPQQ
jgi:arylamine N-acetyltransferase